MKTLRQLSAVFNEGGKITTPELQFLYEHFAALESDLRVLHDPAYDLVVKDIALKVHRCESYLRARQQR